MKYFGLLIVERAFLLLHVISNKPILITIVLFLSRKNEWETPSISIVIQRYKKRLHVIGHHDYLN
jgi:hypothetical protein